MLRMFTNTGSCYVATEKFPAAKNMLALLLLQLLLQLYHWEAFLLPVCIITMCPTPLYNTTTFRPCGYYSLHRSSSGSTLSEKPLTDSMTLVG